MCFRQCSPLMTWSSWLNISFANGSINMQNCSPFSGLGIVFHFLLSMTLSGVGTIWLPYEFTLCLGLEMVLTGLPSCCSLKKLECNKEELQLPLLHGPQFIRVSHQGRTRERSLWHLCKDGSDRCLLTSQILSFWPKSWCFSLWWCLNCFRAHSLGGMMLCRKGLEAERLSPKDWQLSEAGIQMPWSR